MSRSWKENRLFQVGLELYLVSFILPSFRDITWGSIKIYYS